jgi:hypothetical protein
MICIAASSQVDREQQSKLCVHKLPDGTTAAAVRAAFLAACKQAAAAASSTDAKAAEAAAAAVEAAAAEDVGGLGSKPQLLLAFAHPGLANSAFGALPGTLPKYSGASFGAQLFHGCRLPASCCGGSEGKAFVVLSLPHRCVHALGGQGLPASHSPALQHVSNGISCGLHALSYTSATPQTWTRRRL